MEKIIRIAAVAIRNEQDEILHVRKRGTGSFIMVGGKLEHGESGLDAALREVREETAIELTEDDVECLGQFTAPAANEANHAVVCNVFVTTRPRTFHEVTVLREIEEWKFFALNSEADNLAPLSRDVVHPALQDWLKKKQ